MSAPASPRAVLFDMDGVLVRSEEVWFQVVAQAGVRFRGRAISREEFFPTFGQGTAADIPAFALSCTVAELDAFYVEEFPRHLGAVWVNPDARELLAWLRARGLQTALVTNTVAPLAVQVLAHAGLALEVVSTPDRAGRSKPAPDIVHYALRGLGLGPEEAWMVGDSRFDRQAAAAAGVRFVGLGLDGDLRLETLGGLRALLAGASPREA